MKTRAIKKIVKIYSGTILDVSNLKSLERGWDHADDHYIECNTAVPVVELQEQLGPRK